MKVVVHSRSVWPLERCRRLWSFLCLLHLLSHLDSPKEASVHSGFLLGWRCSSVSWEPVEFFDFTAWSLKTSMMWKVCSLTGCVCWKYPGKIWSLLPKLKPLARAEISVNALSASGEGLGRVTPSWEQNRCHGSKGCPNKMNPWTYMNCIWLGLKWGRRRKGTYFSEDRWPYEKLGR